MGYFSHLYFTASRQPPVPGELDESPDAFLSSGSHVPLLWLALFSPGDLVDLPEDEDGLSWPHLVKPTGDAVRLLASREAVILHAFPKLQPVWLAQFRDLLRAAVAPLVHVDTRDIGSLLESPALWRQELALMLGIFETPPLKPAGGWVGSLMRRTQPSDEWAAFHRQLGRAFDQPEAHEPWPYCGGSGGLRPVAWELAG